MSAENWVKILFTYGPFAILILLILVGEPKIRRAKKEAPAEEKWTFAAVYVLNWIAVIGLAIFSAYAWADKNLGQEQTIRGRVDRLTGIETLTTTSADLFFRKERVSGLRYDYKWRLVSPRRLPDGHKINITVDPTNGNGGEADIVDYDLTINPDFYETEVRIFYEPGQKKMFVESASGTVELPRSTSPLAAPAKTAGSARSPWSLFGTVAHAQAAPQPADFGRALESPDAIVRRNARAELAQQGAAAAPWIEEVLANPESSYRLKLGVIVALGNMTGLRPGALKPQTVDALIAAANDSDEALRNEARGVVRRYRLSPLIVYEHHQFDGKSQDFLPGTYAASKQQFGELPNDAASSLRVARGYAALLCENEGGGDGQGRGLCKRYGEGAHQLTGGVADRVSFIQVSKTP